jgi:hypothetical protein
MTTQKLLTVGTVLLSTLIAACGGGGGTSAPITQVSSAQGVYQGTVSNNRQHNTMVLENDQFYTLYGNIVNGVFGVVGFIQGNGKSNNGSFSSTDLRDFLSNGTVVSGSLSASYSPNVSFNGTITEGTSTVTFTGASLQNSSYNYNTGPSLANIVGAWSLTIIQCEIVALTISATGSFTATSGGCNFSGTLKPRASGKNVFDVALTFGAAPCLLAGQSTSGIALEYPVGGGKR